MGLHAWWDDGYRSSWLEQQPKKEYPFKDSPKHGLKLFSSRRPTEEEQCPVYRENMKNAGRGHLLP